MDISPSSIVVFRPEYTFHLRKRKSPDLLMMDYLYGWGEFSLRAEEIFEKHLQDNLKHKQYAHNTISNSTLV